MQQHPRSLLQGSAIDSLQTSLGTKHFARTRCTSGVPAGNVEQQNPFSSNPAAAEAAQVPHETELEHADIAT